MIEKLLFVSSGPRGLKQDQTVPFAQIANEELIMPSPRHELRAILDDCARKAGVELKASVEADSYSALINLVQHGFGSTVLPLAPIYELVQKGLLCAAPIVDPTPTRKLVLVYPADRPVSPAARFVGESLIGIAADLSEKSIWMGDMIASVRR